MLSMNDENCAQVLKCMERRAGRWGWRSERRAGRIFAASDCRSRVALIEFWQIREVLEGVGEWEWNVFDLVKVAKGHELKITGWCVADVFF
jgi:hypothetical protein